MNSRIVICIRYASRYGVELNAVKNFKKYNIFLFFKILFKTSKNALKNSVTKIQEVAPSY